MDHQDPKCTPKVRMSQLVPDFLQTVTVLKSFEILENLDAAPSVITQAMSEHTQNDPHVEKINLYWF